METQVLGQAYFHPAFILHPLLFCPPPPPTHSPSSLNLQDDETGVQGLGEETREEAARWRRPLIVVICCKHDEKRVVKNLFECYMLKCSNNNSY